MYIRILLVALAALLALPLAQTASPVEAKKRSRAVTRTFRSSAPIEIPYSTQVDPIAADPYPATIEVNGLRGTIRDVNLTLHGLYHYTPSDLDVVLVGPRGQTAVVMARVGKFASLPEEETLRLDDEAAASLPASAELQSGAYRPTNLGGAIAFPAPAPETGANAALSVFDGSNPNGAWRLFVVDEDATDEYGAIKGGWSLEIKARVKKKR
jgi:hypothetical protein